MATLIRTDLVVHLSVEAYKQQVIEANRRMAELGLKRVDRGGGKYPKPPYQTEKSE
jgi:hypothetical protein